MEKSSREKLGPLGKRALDPADEDLSIGTDGYPLPMRAPLGESEGRWAP